MSIIASSTPNELSKSSFSSKFSQYGNALSISHVNTRPTGSLLLPSPTRRLPVSVAVAAGARRVWCGQKSRMAPRFMFKQRCPATIAEDDDELVGPSKQRVVSRNQHPMGLPVGGSTMTHATKVRRKIEACARARPDL